MRTDIHRPGAIRPQEYRYVGIWRDGNWTRCGVDVAGYVGWVERERQRILDDMQASGGAWAQHRHGGTCQCCGARAAYLGVFHHTTSNEYIRIGERCMEKMDMGEPKAFRAARASVSNAIKLITKKRRAQKLLASANLQEAWDMFATESARQSQEEELVKSIVRSVVNYGSLTEKQQSFLSSLLYKIRHRDEILRQRSIEKALAEPCPEGRLIVSGIVLSTKVTENIYGPVRKMLVRVDAGYTLWGSIPTGIDAERGVRVTFKATIKPSEKDSKHGFFSRPTIA